MFQYSLECTNEQSYCGDECRSTANFCEAFRCCEVVGLAVVESVARFTGSLPSYTKSATYLTAPLPSSLYREHTKILGLHKPLFSILYDDQTNVQECMQMVKWGVKLVASEPKRAPGYYITL